MAGVTLRNIVRNIALRNAPAKAGSVTSEGYINPPKGIYTPMLRPCPAIGGVA